MYPSFNCLFSLLVLLLWTPQRSSSGLLAILWYYVKHLRWVLDRHADLWAFFFLLSVPLCISPQTQTSQAGSSWVLKEVFICNSSFQSLWKTDRWMCWRVVGFFLATTHGEGFHPHPLLILWSFQNWSTMISQVLIQTSCELSSTEMLYCSLLRNRNYQRQILSWGQGTVTLLFV